MVINTPRRPEANAAPQSFLIGYLLAFLLNNWHLFTSEKYPNHGGQMGQQKRN